MSILSNIRDRAVESFIRKNETVQRFGEVDEVSIDAESRIATVKITGAIVMSPSVTVKSTPAANGTDLFILHEGTKVTITDGSMRDWKEIRLADGKEGWIESKKIELI